MTFAPRVALLGLLAIALTGCGWLGQTSTETADGDEPDPAEPVIEPVQGPIVPDQPETVLALNLRPGERFPLVKSVRQTLQQATPNGPVVSRSDLRLQLVITVESVDADGNLRLGVQYHGVRYSHDLAGERVEYDSARPPRTIPESVLAYHGLVGHGFSFEIGPDNQLKDVIGFKGFLEQCLRDVPPSRRNAVLAELEATQGEEGFANFVDDSIALLPYDAARTGRESFAKPGYKWERRRQISRPIPIVEVKECTLRTVGNDVAEVDVTGKITPSQSFGPSSQRNDVSVEVENGHVVGTCTIRRSSGLPIRAQVERFFNMVVTTPQTNTKFQQRKHVVTTIETYEEQRSSDPRPIIVPAAGVRPSGPERPVVPADFSGG